MSDEPCTRRYKLSMRERLNRRAVGMCMNGCDKPIQPPSQVVCADCLEAMGEELKAMLLCLEGTKKP